MSNKKRGLVFLLIASFFLSSLLPDLFSPHTHTQSVVAQPVQASSSFLVLEHGSNLGSISVPIAANFPSAIVISTESGHIDEAQQHQLPYEARVRHVCSLTHSFSFTHSLIHSLLHTPAPMIAAIQVMGKVRFHTKVLATLGLTNNAVCETTVSTATLDNLLGAQLQFEFQLLLDFVHGLTFDTFFALAEYLQTLVSLARITVIELPRVGS